MNVRSKSLKIIICLTPTPIFVNEMPKKGTHKVTFYAKKKKKKKK
jgi:hypothetical protein